MAHKDYVSRGRKTNKKNNPYKNNQPQAESIPLRVKFIGLVTMVGISLFAYMLYSIKDKQAETPAPSKPAVVNKQSDKTELPAPPEEKWVYMEELKTKEVEVGEYEVEQKGPYLMQCGSFRTEKQANELKAMIAFAGLESAVRASRGQNGLWYKVVLGPYERKRLAEKDKHKLKSNNVNHCQIWLWN